MKFLNSNPGIGDHCQERLVVRTLPDRVVDTAGLAILIFVQASVYCHAGKVTTLRHLSCTMLPLTAMEMHQHIKHVGTAPHKSVHVTSTEA